MNPLEDHWIDDMSDWDTHTSSPEFEVCCKCGHTFTAQGSYRFEDAITMWGRHVQEEQE